MWDQSRAAAVARDEQCRSATVLARPTGPWLLQTPGGVYHGSGGTGIAASNLLP